MKQVHRNRLIVSMAAGLTVVALTACGTAPSSGSQSQANSTDSNVTQPANSSGTQAQPPTLTTFTDSKLGVTVSVPQGWTQSGAPSGGDYAGDTFTNPDDPTQTVTVVKSSCAGCYKNVDGSINVEKVIPHTGYVVTNKSADSMTVTYTFTIANNSNPGLGTLTATPKNGYAYVEILLPSSEGSLAVEIANSLTVSS